MSMSVATFLAVILVKLFCFVVYGVLGSRV